MKTLDTPGRIDYATMTTEQLRSAFLVQDLFRPGSMQAYLTEMDRAIVGSAVSTVSCLSLSAIDAGRSLGQRRELGIMNLGGEGRVNGDRSSCSGTTCST